MAKPEIIGPAAPAATLSAVEGGRVEGSRMIYARLYGWRGRGGGGGGVASEVFSV